jgi:hypothetical protein
MPYAPGQPWDATLSYSYGQTCTFNGLPYVYWHTTSPSTVGVNPFNEMKDFVAVNVFGGGGTATRPERAWVLADEVIDFGGGEAWARYGNVKELQRRIRGISPLVTDGFLYEGSIYPAFWSSTPGNLIDYSWQFYGMTGLSAEFGKANNTVSPPVPETSGNSNIASSSIWVNTNDPLPYNPSLPLQQFVSTGLTSGKIEVDFVVQEKAYSPSFINEFNRDASYTITVTISGPGGTTYDINGTISSGPFRDGFSLRANSIINSHSVSWSPGQFMSYTFKVNGLSPRYDA